MPDPTLPAWRVKRQAGSAKLQLHTAPSSRTKPVLLSCLPPDKQRHWSADQGEVGAGEKASCLVLAVKQRDVRLDLMPHQPPDHQTRSVGGISGQPLRLEAEAISGPFEHGFGCGDLGSPAGRRRLDIDDDRPPRVDQIIGAVSREFAANLERNSITYRSRRCGCVSWPTCIDHGCLR
jgi:hypothetical protein